MKEKIKGPDDKKSPLSFEARIEIIGINPFVFVPEEMLQSIFNEAKKDKGPVPVCGTVNGMSYRQTLVRYSGHWRLYINTAMLKDSPKRIGETIAVTIAYDPKDRTIDMHPQLVAALAAHPDASAVFKRLTPSLQKEIVRYIAALKTEATVEKNIKLAIEFLKGNGRFAGRDKPR